MSAIRESASIAEHNGFEETADEARGELNNLLRVVEAARQVWRTENRLRVRLLDDPAPAVKAAFNAIDSLRDAVNDLDKGDQD